MQISKKAGFQILLFLIILRGFQQVPAFASTEYSINYKEIKVFKIADSTLFYNQAKTPPMGWNSWNWFGKPNINEKIVKEVIDAMAKEGLRDAGYNYIVVDGGWRDTKLTPNGGLLANPKKFPSGMKALADYAHSKGLKFGLHTVPGTHDCGGDKVGGYGNEEVQLQQFIDWGLDFIKLDRCKLLEGGWNEELLTKTYTKWSDLIKKSGKEIILNVSAYEYRDWNPQVSQMSRTTLDIGAKANGGARFDYIKKSENFHSVMQIAEQNNEDAKHARPGYWNDPDMLVTGSQGLSIDEQKSHFALWCIMSSPLFLGNDPRFMTPEEKSIITNKEAIRINQDPTEQGIRIKSENGTEIWAKKMRGGQVAVLFLNRSSFEAKNISISLKELGFSGKTRGKDVYSGKKMGTLPDNVSQVLKPQTSIFFLLSGV